MNKFNDAFVAASNGKFPYLRFVRAEFSNTNQNLKLFFLIKSAIMDDGFTEGDKAEVIRICTGLIPLKPDETFSVSYVKAYADEEVVRAKFTQFLNKKEPILLQKIKPEDVTVEVDEYFINLTVTCMPNDKAILSSAEISEKLIENFNENFVENINLNIASRYVDKTKKEEIEAEKRKNMVNSAENREIIVNSDGTVNRTDDAFSDLLESFDESIVVYENSRLISAKAEHCILGKGALVSMPGYICDVKESFESATICGTVCGLQKKDYANKNYGQPAGNGKGRFKKNVTDERLPIYIFNLNDTTGTFPVVCFPRDNKTEAIDVMLTDGHTVVASGALGISKRGEFQMTADNIWLAEVDFSSINRESEKKPTPNKYQNLQPDKYIEAEQAVLGDYLDKPKEVPELLKGKTYVAFDFETTGVDVNSVMIVQMGAAKIADGNIVETMSTLVNPMCHIPESSTAIHGITDDMVLSAPEFYEVLPDFYKFTRGATLVGQCVFSYDMPILNRFAKLYGYEFDNPIMDTYVMAKNKLRLPRYNLDTLCKHFDVELFNAHKADCDALATAKCFIKLAALM